jgi:nicotinate-nucleotide pyrophosphorylase (carboxylating)
MAGTMAMTTIMHNQLNDSYLRAQRQAQVRAALAEDLGQIGADVLDPGADLTARLVAADTQAEARIITREAAIVCGIDWVNELFALLDPGVSISWRCQDGDSVGPNDELCRLKGPARALLTGERSALNFLQTLSATATATRAIVAQLPSDSRLQLLDTRKTVPGLRAAQKYAVRVGGGGNHRIGLFDAFLIKENHIAACGGIAAAVTRARAIAPGTPVEVEVESFDELEQALNAGADIIMLDEFDDADLPKAVALTHRRAKLEVSGSVSAERLHRIAAAGVDYVSMGALTKHVRAIDLSMRIEW